MSIFNKDSLKDTLCKISTSAMDVAENVVKATKESANNVAKKSNDILEISKLNLNIASEKSKVEEAYYEIGKSIYLKYSKNIYIDPEVVDICKSIRETEFRIAVMEDRISDLKNLCKCDNCGESLKENSNFCPNCGHEQVNKHTEPCDEDHNDCKQISSESSCCDDCNCNADEKPLEPTNNNDSNENDSNNLQ